RGGVVVRHAFAAVVIVLRVDGARDGDGCSKRGTRGAARGTRGARATVGRMRQNCGVVGRLSGGSRQVVGGAEHDLVDLHAVFTRLNADGVGPTRAEHDEGALSRPVP